MHASFPSKQGLLQLLGDNDYFLWEYYSNLLGWIFRSRLKVVLSFLKELQPKPRRILDVGCGPMFISYPLITTSTGEYFGIDVLPVKELKKYKDVMNTLGVRKIAVIRASAEALPLRNNVFEFILSLDVLEHLLKPKGAIMEIYRVAKNGASIAISLPLENLIQKISRISFKLTKPKPFPNNNRESIPKRKKIPITRTPDYHYVGDVDSHDHMYNILREIFEPLISRFTPLGFQRAININAVHVFRKKYD